MNLKSIVRHQTPKAKAKTAEKLSQLAASSTSPVASTLTLSYHLLIPGSMSNCGTLSQVRQNGSTKL